jgi:dynein heavy chain
MSNELDEVFYFNKVFNSIYDNKVPEMWHNVAYPSLKPLASWINDFLERLKFIQKWIDEG